MRLRHTLADLLDERQHNQRSNGMTDERRNNQDQAAEHNQHTIQTHPLDLLGDAVGDGVEQAGAVDGFAERETAGGEDDDGPEEVVEVLLGEDAGAEEEHDGDDGDDAHVAEDGLELVGDAPEDDGEDGDDADEPLDAGEPVAHAADRHDGRALAGLEGEQQEDPDDQDADDADREGDEEPHTPPRLR